MKTHNKYMYLGRIMGMDQFLKGSDQKLKNISQKPREFLKGSDQKLKNTFPRNQEQIWALRTTRVQAVIGWQRLEGKQNEQMKRRYRRGTREILKTKWQISQVHDPQGIFLRLASSTALHARPRFSDLRKVVDDTREKRSYLAS